MLAAVVAPTRRNVGFIYRTSSTIIPEGPLNNAISIFSNNIDAKLQISLLWEISLLCELKHIWTQTLWVQVQGIFLTLLKQQQLEPEPVKPLSCGSNNFNESQITSLTRAWSCRICNSSVTQVWVTDSDPHLGIVREPFIHGCWMDEAKLFKSW